MDKLVEITYGALLISLISFLTLTFALLSVWILEVIWHLL